MTATLTYHYVAGPTPYYSQVRVRIPMESAYVCTHTVVRGLIFNLSAEYIADDGTWVLGYQALCPSMVYFVFTHTRQPSKSNSLTVSLRPDGSFVTVASGFDIEIKEEQA